MTRPNHYLLRMIVFLLAVLVLAAVLSGPLLEAFGANPVLNAVILGVMLLGIAWNIRQVVTLNPEVAWLEGFREPRAGAPARGGAKHGAPQLLAPMASMFATRRGDRLSLSAPAMRSVLDGIASRLDESRELSRYVTGLSIFLGLLGTFWGLILTIGSVAEVISSMSVGSGDINQLFNQLKTGLTQPLRGMGVAFSSSMLGLAGALVLGFLDLTAGQAQTRFYNELEEWLAGVTRLSSGVLGDGGAEGGGSVPAYVQALLEQTAENLENLQRIMTRGEEGRAASGQALVTLTERLSVLADQMRASQVLMQRVAEGQAALAPTLTRMAEAQSGFALDEASRTHLRNLEIYMSRLVEDVAQGRAQATAEIRGEIKILARTIAALADEGPR
ncbi:MotA/TolQ/ExbB proton channel family protein [Roseomonas haemaphysalidis]|uniref:MotA/TolQ/ExbB proton channel family protein n=1 Tax=Roseomonas haemaphysalidis TaxID=2768162 RepID=A0ABS3KNI9_9PROT|nr:MotA/TolQ/ExbB proton channel family protein [Roseomonas haemaphysalidis]MBO1079016.1 MotA/TolQ/ExbB proton channel family protein [Roseomonas haemaphysalidis]